MSLSPLANRGRALEELVEAACLAAMKDGFACVIRQNPRCVLLGGGKSAFPISGAPVDFLGVVRGRGVALECKEVSKGGRLPLNPSRFPEKEVEFLRAFERAGGFAFVVAAFRQHQKTVVVPFRAVSGLIGLLPSISLSEMCGMGREVKSVTGLFGGVGSLLGGMELEGSSLHGD